MTERILVVDDEQDMLDLVTHHLSRQGYDVETAINGLVALRKARRFRPDLVVLDLMLGDLDGFSVCEILRTEPATRRTPILAITAYSGEMPRLNALEAGANDFLPKPFSPAQLLGRVAGLLAGSGLRAEAAEAPARKRLTKERTGLRTEE